MAQCADGHRAVCRASANKRPNDPLLGPATISVGVIQGGVGVNTVPDRCRIEIDRRLITGEDPNEQSAQLMGFLKEKAGIDFPFELTTPHIRMPALSAKGSEEIQKMLVPRSTRSGAAQDSSGSVWHRRRDAGLGWHPVGRVWARRHRESAHHRRMGAARRSGNGGEHSLSARDLRSRSPTLAVYVHAVH